MWELFTSTNNSIFITICKNSYLDFVLVSFGTGALGTWELAVVDPLSLVEWNWDGLGPALDPAGLGWTPGPFLSLFTIPIHGKARTR